MQNMWYETKSLHIFSFRQTWNCSLATEHPVYKLTDNDVHALKVVPSVTAGLHLVYVVLSYLVTYTNLGELLPLG